jgi:hypothetical protein
MKILFLDIDGVLNSKRSDYAFDGRPHDFSARQMAFFDMVAVALVRKLCAATGCSVVLSSDWRYNTTAHAAAAALDLPIMDITPMLHKVSRGVEIHAWLGAHPEVTHYAIVDDINAMLPDQQRHFVQTDETCGLSLDDFHRLHMILAREGK